MKAEYLLSRINEMFKVVDISNPITCANNEKVAIQIHKTKNYDRVLIKDGNDNIVKYYDSNEDKTVPITPADLISESSEILETLCYLSEEHFYFVLTCNKITRIFHYSDLNSPLVSLEIYSQIAYCEKAIHDYAISNNKNETDQNRIKKFLTDINENLTDRKTVCIKQAEG